MTWKWFQKLCTIFRKHLLIILIIFGIIVVSIIISDFYFEWITLFGHTEQYPQKVAAIAMLITALFTLILALATFNATKQSNLREKNRRTDEIKKENRGRKERLLNEILNWAIDVATCEYSVSIEKPSSIFTKLYDKDLRAYDLKDKEKVAQGIMQDHKRVWQSRYMNLHLNYQTLDARGEYILSLSDNKDFESIINTIRAIKAQISDYLEILWKYMKDIDDKLQQEKVIEQGKELNKSAIQLIKEAAKIKAKDIS